MQDHFVGDIHDFAKYGLLRWLCRPDRDGAPAPKLGVVWYRTCEHEVGGGGGNINCYFDPEGAGCREHGFCDQLKSCDPDLARALKQIRARRDRKVTDVEESGVLPCNNYFSDLWSFRGVDDHTRRREKREQLLDDALGSVGDCGALFLDPDVGMDPGRIQGFSAQVDKLKHVLSIEAGSFRSCSSGKRSLILIQFLIPFPVAMTIGKQIERCTKNLCSALEEVQEQHIRTLTFCFRRCSGGANNSPKNRPPLIFFIVPGADHKKWADDRVEALAQDEHWGRFVSVDGRKPRGGCPDPDGRCDACDA